MNQGVDWKLVRVMNAVAAGTSNQNGTAIDMQGYDGCLILTSMGAIAATAVTSVKVQQDTVSGFGTAADVAGSGQALAAGGADDNLVVAHDVYRPTKRFIRPVVLRGTANATIDSIVALLYRGSKRPATNDATIKSLTTLVSPDEGTP